MWPHPSYLSPPQKLFEPKGFHLGWGWVRVTGTGLGPRGPRPPGLPVEPPQLTMPLGRRWPRLQVELIVHPRMNTGEAVRASPSVCDAFIHSSQRQLPRVTWPAFPWVRSYLGAEALLCLGYTPESTEERGYFKN